MTQFRLFCICFLASFLAVVFAFLAWQSFQRYQTERELHQLLAPTSTLEAPAAETEVAGASAMSEREAHDAAMEECRFPMTRGEETEAECLERVEAEYP